MRYKLTCSCGKEHPVEVSSAGQSLLCSCGQTLTIPSMLKFKKLPVWEEDAVPGTADAAGQKAEDASPALKKETASENQPKAAPAGPKRFLSGSRLGILIVGIILTGISGFFLIQTLRHVPHPYDVFQKQRDFILDGSVVRRDSTPIDEADFQFYFIPINEGNVKFFQQINTEKVTAENLEYCRKFNPDLKIGDPVLFKDIRIGTWATINDWLLDRLPAYNLYTYFDYLKNGPALSDNFYENMEILQTQHRLRSGLYTLFFVLSLIVCAVPWLLPKQKRVVGTMRGSEWKA